MDETPPHPPSEPANNRTTSPPPPPPHHQTSFSFISKRRRRRRPRIRLGSPNDLFLLRTLKTPRPTRRGQHRRRRRRVVVHANWAFKSLGYAVDRPPTPPHPPPSLGFRDWLGGLGLARYAPLLETHGVHQGLLPMITLDDLREMGISAVGARRRLYCAIQKLRNTTRRRTTIKRPLSSSSR